MSSHFAGIGAAEPRVSVVIPTHNYARFLGDALRSLQEQTMDSWECIVVDDASVDETRDVVLDLMKTEDRVRYQRLPQNQGPSAARNRGLDLATAGYIQFLDADDRIEAEKLQAHSTFLDANPEVGIVYGPYAYFRTETPDATVNSLKGKLTRPLMDPVSGSGPTLLERLGLHNIMPINAALFRKELLRKVGGFDEEIRGCEDWNLLIHSVIAGASIAYLYAEGTRALVRSHEASASREGERLLSGLIRAANNFEKNLVGEWEGPPPVAFQAASGIDLITKGRRLKGIRELIGATARAGWTLNSVRWIVYALAGAILPRALFRRFAAEPIPEELIEFGMRFTRIFGR